MVNLHPASVLFQDNALGNIFGTLLCLSRGGELPRVHPFI